MRLARRVSLLLFMILAFAVNAEEDKLIQGKHFNKTPEEAAKAMTVPEGFKVTLFAGEPDVRQPNAFCVDDRGRLWVGENYTYTKTGWKPDARDRILIFEDTDGDGKFDKRKVFTDKITYVSGIEVGYGGVWVGSVPNLLFIPDRNGDDKPDGDAEVVLDGWGRQDQHETLNSFIWGPDGWLYGCHGVFTHSRVGKPGTPDKERIPINAGVWRYHPTKKDFEVFAWGTSNPWGIDFDDHGQMMMTACVIPHLWHVVQGGRYHRQAGRHFNPHVYADIRTIAKHTHKGFKGRKGGHAHGGALLYLGDSFPEKYRGKLFMCSIHHHGMYVDQFRRKGSGFEGDHFDDFLQANDRWFLGFNLRPSPDGSIYVIDWYDSKECHGQTPEGKLSGRIFKVSYGDKKAKPVNVAALSDEALVQLQLHNNDWFVRHARRVLAERAASGKKMDKAQTLLREMLDKNPSVARKLRALWTLHSIGATNEELLSGLLVHKEEYLRAWAIQLLTEGKEVSEAVVKKFTEMAANDESAVVRLYLASALQRLPLSQRWGIVENLIQHGEDETDHNLALMYWYGLEPLVAKDKARALKLSTKSKLKLIRQHVARRATSR